MKVQQSRPLALKNPNNDPKPPNDDRGKGVLGDNVFLDSAILGSASYTAASLYPSTWLHEMGHAKMAEALFVNADPVVEVFPLKGGVTHWRPGKLSALGEKVGRETAMGMVSGAGAVVDMAVAATAFGTGFKLRKKHPLIGAALMGYGAMSVINDIGYAATALGSNVKPGNDFASLSTRIGLHPVASIAIMASILPLEYLALKWLEDRA